MRYQGASKQAVSIGRSAWKIHRASDTRSAPDRGPRAAASAAGIMNRRDPRCRARRQERGSWRIREKNRHLRGRTYTRPARRGEAISQSERFISPSVQPPRQSAHVLARFIGPAASFSL